MDIRRLIPTSQNKKRLMAIGLVILILSTIILVYSKRRPRNTGDETGAAWLFHPDSVVQLDWSTKGEKAESFARSDRNHPWKPDVQPMRMQDKLNTLSSLKLISMDAPSKGPVQVILTFSDQQVWDGIFDGENFIWTSGHFEGMGAKLSVDQARIFQEGRGAFQDHNRNWCPKRVKSVKVGSRFALELQGLKWMISGDKPREADPTFIEKWFGKYCTAEAEFLIDYDVAKHQDNGESLVIEYDGGVPNAEFNIVDKTQFFGEKIGIVSREFGIALAELIDAPAKAP